MDNYCVKYYSDLMLHVWPKHGHGEQRCEILDMIEQTDGQTNGQTDEQRNSYITQNFVFVGGGGGGGGYK